MTIRRHLVIPVLGLAVAGALSGVLVVTSSPTSSAMSEMDMSGSTPAPADHGEMPGMDMPASTPAPADHGEMPGMDMPEAEHGSGEAESGHGSGEAESGHGSGDMPGMEHGAGDTSGAASDRPLAPVLGTFGGGSAAVLLTAGMLRRKDRAANLAKKTARAAGRAQK